MNLVELLKRLKELRERAVELRAIPSEDFTDELLAEFESNNEERGTVTRKIAAINDASDFDDGEDRTSNGSIPGQSSGIEVPDQPIYRSRFPLGEQMMDIRAATVDGPGASDARERLGQVVTRENERPENRAAGTGMVQAVGSDGGFLLQGESAIELMTNGFNNNAILSRTKNRVMTSQYIDIVQLKESSRATGSRGGGIRVYTDKELAQMTSSKTEFRKLRVEPKRLTGLYYASDEILNDAPMLEGEMASLFTDEFSFKAQDIALNGSGAGEGLGILNSGSLISQAKETGQAAATIVAENIYKMESRLLANESDMGNVVWLANREIKPQLPTLNLAIGTGGALVPLYQPRGSNVNSFSTIDGIPLIIIEQAAALGTVGDLVLCDLSKYLTASKGGINSASSIHLKFDYNQTTFRFVTWFDGQPEINSAITPYKGSATVSPFVALATRS